MLFVLVLFQSPLIWIQKESYLQILRFVRIFFETVVNLYVSTDQAIYRYFKELIKYKFSQNYYFVHQNAFVIGEAAFITT